MKDFFKLIFQLLITRFLLVTYLAFSAFTFTSISAQPSNDNCIGALPIVLTQGGTACINATSINATADATPPNVCNAPTGGNEVWFTFIANGPLNSINVFPSGGSPALQVSVSVYSGNCGSALNVCNTAATALDTAIVNFASTQGTQVWFEVSGLQGDGTFGICITSFDNTNPPPYSPGVGDSCTTPILICNKSPFTTLGPTSFSSSGTYLSCYPFGLLNDIWFRFDVGKTGTLEWIAQPLGSIELDWEVIDISAGCPGNVVACNKVVGAFPGLPTGMSAAATGNCTTTQICFPILVNAGSTYVLHINNYSGTPGIGFGITWGGTFEMYPNPEFTINTPSGCPPLTTSFTDLSYGANNYSWNFGNGNTSNSNNPPAQTYNNPGTYMVTLSVSGSNGCSHIYSQGVTVSTNPPISTFNIADTAVCAGDVDTLVYTGTSSIAATYNWNIAGATILSGSGQGPLVVQWNTSGIKSVSLEVIENGCTSNITSHGVTIYNLPTSTFNIPSSACVGDTVLVTYTGNANSSALYFWNFGNSFASYFNGTDTAKIYWPVSGLDSVYLIVIDNGCWSTITYNNINIGAQPTSTFSIADTSCAGNAVVVNYTGSATIAATYNWNFGGGNANPGGTVQGPQNIIWNTQGYHAVTLSVTENGCTSTNFKDSIYILYAPVSNFTVSDDSLCGNETTTISFTGTAGPNAIFNWNFSGANIVSGTGSGPYLLNWAAPGKHFITLDINEAGCNSQTKTDSIYSEISPVADAGNDMIFCNGDSIQIGGPSTPGYLYQWTPAAGLSNNSISNPYVNLVNNTSNPIIKNYIVTVSKTFCTDKDTVVVTINPRQLASINVTTSLNQCLSGNSFNFKSVPPYVTGATFNWQFGATASPSTSNLANVNGVNYSAAGIYPVTLTTSTAGCPDDSDLVTVTVFATPDVAFSANKTISCPPLEVQFTDLSNTPPGSTYLWNFGNLITSSVQNPTYTYTVSGSYNVSLTVTTPDNCDSTLTINNFITLTLEPKASFSTSPTVGNIVTPNIEIINQSLNADSCIFYLGDGTMHSGCDNFYHQYQDTGTYLVTLVTFSAGGCSDTTFREVIINPFYTLYIPRAFTPNTDLLNDTWDIKGEGISEFELKVFNRKGQLAFESYSIDHAWNGKYKETEEDCQEDVYAYVINVRDALGKPHSYRGMVAIIR